MFHIFFTQPAQLTYNAYWVPVVLALILHSAFTFVMQVKAPVTNVIYRAYSSLHRRRG